MLTIFSTPKPFRGHINIIQRGRQRLPCSIPRKAELPPGKVRF